MFAFKYRYNETYQIKYAATV